MMLPPKSSTSTADKLKSTERFSSGHSRKHGSDVDVNAEDEHKDSQKSKELKCEGDNTGPVTELKVGTEDNQACCCHRTE